MMYQKQRERAATEAGTYAQSKNTSQKEAFLIAGEARGAHGHHLPFIKLHYPDHG